MSIPTQGKERGDFYDYISKEIAEARAAILLKQYVWLKQIFEQVKSLHTVSIQHEPEKYMYKRICDPTLIDETYWYTGSVCPIEVSDFFHIQGSIAPHFRLVGTWTRKDMDLTADQIASKLAASVLIVGR